jgi:hypothetical protein
VENNLLDIIKTVRDLKEAKLNAVQIKDLISYSIEEKKRSSLVLKDQKEKPEIRERVSSDLEASPVRREILELELKKLISPNPIIK